MLDEAGRLVVVDLGAAVRLSPGGLLHRLLFPALSRVDTGALLKWRRTLLLPADAGEWKRVQRGERWRRTWWLNPKRRRGA